MDKETVKAWKQLYYANNPKLEDRNQDQAKFIKWFFNRKEIKQRVKEFMKNMFRTESQDCSDAIDAFAYEIDKIIAAVVPGRESPPTSPGKKRYLEKWMPPEESDVEDDLVDEF